MLRKQPRRSFIVEIKHSPTSGRSFIPIKPPQAPGKGKHLASPTSSLASVFEQKTLLTSVTGEATEPRRILPSLIVWEPSAPEHEFEFDVQPEVPLPRVRRAVPLQEAAKEASHRRGKPPKLKLEPEPVAETAIVIHDEPVLLRPEGSASSRSLPKTPVPSPRNTRPDAAGLSRAERWKRRLPRACW